MNITIIGSGNVATILGKLFKENNHAVKEVVGRNKIAARSLAEILTRDIAPACNK
jgi:glycerol-3-phosphate dehydrogenase